MNSGYQHIRNFLQRFIKRWQNKYLLEFREFHISKARNKIEEACNTMDVVLIYEHNTLVLILEWVLLIVSCLHEIVL